MTHRLALAITFALASSAVACTRETCPTEPLKADGLGIQRHMTGDS
jgi:hypothetical protein